MLLKYLLDTVSAARTQIIRGHRIIVSRHGNTISSATCLYRVAIHSMSSAPRETVRRRSATPGRIESPINSLAREAGQ